MKELYDLLERLKEDIDCYSVEAEVRDDILILRAVWIEFPFKEGDLSTAITKGWKRCYPYEVIDHIVDDEILIQEFIGLAREGISA